MRGLFSPGPLSWENEPVPYSFEVRRSSFEVRTFRRARPGTINMDRVIPTKTTERTSGLGGSEPVPYSPTNLRLPYLDGRL
jgi:hypothetical protein